MSARIRMAVIGAAALIALAMPAAALGVEVSSHVVSRVGGPELVRQALSQIRGVQLGSTSATVTVVTDDGLHEIGVDLSGAVQGASGVPGISAVPGAAAVSGAPIPQGDVAGLLRLAALPIVLGSVIRLLRFLARLGSM